MPVLYCTSNPLSG